VPPNGISLAQQGWELTGVPMRQLTNTQRLLKSEEGLTFVELLVVSAIIGIMVTLLVPLYTQWNARTQLRQAVTEINSDLTIARMAAMNRNQPVTVSVTLASSRVSVATADGSGSQVLPGRTMYFHVTGATSTPAPTPSSAPITVTFSPRGLRTSATGTATQLITFSNTYGVQYSIGVAQSGKAKWCPAATCT
jgi:type IV pilus assembly protein PilA